MSKIDKILVFKILDFEGKRSQKAERFRIKLFTFHVISKYEILKVFHEVTTP